VGTHQKSSLLKQLPTYFIAKREKGVGTLFPRVPAPLHLWGYVIMKRLQRKLPKISWMKRVSLWQSNRHI